MKFNPLCPGAWRQLLLAPSSSRKKARMETCREEHLFPFQRRKRRNRAAAIKSGGGVPDLRRRCPFSICPTGKSGTNNGWKLFPVRTKSDGIFRLQIKESVAVCYCSNSITQIQQWNTMQIECCFCSLIDTLQPQYFLSH